MFLDGISLMVLTIPVAYPAVTALGFDPLWFAVFLVLMIEMGAITPPVGLNLYVIHGIDKYGTLGNVIVGTMPFFGAMLMNVVILTAFPILALWLPSHM